MRTFSVLFAVGLVAALSQSALAASNCNEIKDSIRTSYDVTHFGLCQNPDAATAVLQGCGDILALVVLEGGVNRLDCGQRAINNWTIVFGQRVPLPNTFLPYAGGDQITFAPSNLSPEGAQDEAKDIILNELENLGFSQNIRSLASSCSASNESGGTCEVSCPAGQSANCQNASGSNPPSCTCSDGQ